MYDGTERLVLSEIVSLVFSNDMIHLRVTVLLLRLMLSGVVGLVTAQLWVPHFRLQLLRVLRSDLFHLDTSGVLLILQIQMFSNQSSVDIYFL